VYYRNRIVFSASVAMAFFMLAVAVYFLFFDSGVPESAWGAVLALALPCGVIWVIIRVGLSPFVEWGDGKIVVCNPFVLYSSSLDKVRLLGREGKGGAFEVEGIGTVVPWAMTRSIFDGKRANEARRELRRAVLQAKGEAVCESDAQGTRKIRYGWSDILMIPFLAACVWAFLP